jgi:hypothetical protein
MPSNHISNEPYHEWLKQEATKHQAARDGCVVCNRLTHYPKRMPISFRENYVLGVGQLCPRCYKEYAKETH